MMKNSMIDKKTIIDLFDVKINFMCNFISYCLSSLLIIVILIIASLILSFISTLSIMRYHYNIPICSLGFFCRVLEESIPRSYTTRSTTLLTSSCVVRSRCSTMTSTWIPLVYNRRILCYNRSSIFTGMSGTFTDESSRILITTSFQWVMGKPIDDNFQMEYGC